MHKTVYILGAGFSREANAPSQENILFEIKKLDKTYVNSLHDLDLNKHWDNFEKTRQELFDFLKELFHCSYDDVCNIELEDAFTLLDKAVLKHQFIYNYSDEVITQNRRKLNFCLVYMFDAKLKDPDVDFYDALADKIVRLRKSLSIDDDVISFINLNWDLLLDNAINSKSNYLSERANKTAVDYCFYTDSFDKDPNHISHIKLKAKNIKNIKILKPHGSFNWLVCMNCGKVFIKFGGKIALFEFIEEKYCAYCNKRALKAVIKTPTLIKDFDNVHLSDVLHNTQIELFEAKRVVFIGYSLPLADIELRYIFKRCIDKNATVEAVLINDNRFDEVIQRFRRFFGTQLINNGFEKAGSVAFLKNEFKF